MGQPEGRQDLQIAHGLALLVIFVTSDSPLLSTLCETGNIPWIAAIARGRFIARSRYLHVHGNSNRSKTQMAMVEVEYSAVEEMRRVGQIPETHAA